MDRRNLLKGLLGTGIFGTLFAIESNGQQESEQLCKYADVRNGVWIEAKLPYGDMGLR